MTAALILSLAILIAAAVWLLPSLGIPPLAAVCIMVLPVAFLLGFVLRRREPVHMTEPIQDDDWTKIEVHYG